MTASYDGTLRIWDERNLKSEVSCLKTEGKSLWEVNFSNSPQKGPYSFGIPAIYDGYLFYKNKDPNFKFTSFADPSFSFEDFDLTEYKGHESICYAFEFLPDSDLILSSSFYDNTLHLIKPNDSP